MLRQAKQESANKKERWLVMKRKNENMMNWTYSLSAFVVSAILVSGCGVERRAIHEADQAPQAQAASSQVVEAPAALVEEKPAVIAEEPSSYQQWTCKASINNSEASTVTTEISTSLSSRSEEIPLQDTNTQKLVLVTEGSTLKLQVQSLLKTETLASSTVTGTTEEVYMHSVVGKQAIEVSCKRQFSSSEQQVLTQLRAETQEATYVCHDSSMMIKKDKKKKDLKKKLGQNSSNEFLITMKASEVNKSATMMFDNDHYAVGLENYAGKAGMIHLNIDTKSGATSRVFVDMTAKSFQTTLNDGEMIMVVSCDRQGAADPVAVEAVSAPDRTGQEEETIIIETVEAEEAESLN